MTGAVSQNDEKDLGWVDERKLVQVERLFESKPCALSRRNNDLELSWFVRAYNKSHIWLTMFHIPVVRSVVLRRPITATKTQSAEHFLMKRATMHLLHLMKLEDAREEFSAYGMRFDVASPASNLFFEVGNTSIKKMKALIESETAYRFTIVPFQKPATDALDGSEQCLLAVCIKWGRELTEAVSSRNGS